MGHGQNRGQIQGAPQKKAMANEKNQGLGGKDLTKEESKEKESTEELQEEVTEPVEEMPEAKVEEEIPAEAEAEEKKVEAVVEEKEEAKAPTREKELEEEIVEERIYTVPLGKAWIMPPRKRSPRAMRILKAFVTKHMKLEAKKEEEEEEEPATLVITNEVNERIWVRGAEKPPRKIRIRATKDKDGNIKVHLAEGD